MALLNVCHYYYYLLLLFILIVKHAVPQLLSTNQGGSGVRKSSIGPADDFFEYDVEMTMRAAQVKITLLPRNTPLIPYYWTPNAEGNYGESSFLLTVKDWPTVHMADTSSDLYRAVKNAFIRLNTIILNNVDALVVLSLNVTSISPVVEDIKVLSDTRVRSRRFYTLNSLARAISKSSQSLMNSEWATDTFGLDGVWLDITVSDAKLAAEINRMKKSNSNQQQQRFQQLSENSSTAAATITPNCCFVTMLVLIYYVTLF